MNKLYLPLLFILVALPVQAATLYVNNSGSPTCSDSYTYPGTGGTNNSASNPWCTIGRAAWGSTSYSSPNASQAAAAGDIVLVTAGIYSTHGDTSPTGRFNVALNPANTGTSGSPITFRGVGTVEIRMNSGYYGPMIGACNGRNYIIWDNFYIDDYYSGSVSDTGPVVFNGSTGSQLINSEVKGHPGSYYNGQSTFTDNYNGIRLEATNGITIKNNEIWQVVGRMHNEAGIMTYDAANSIIEHNYIHDCYTGIFIKGDHADDGWPQEDNIIRYNWIEDCQYKGVFLIGGHGTQIYQNVIKGVGSTGNESPSIVLGPMSTNDGTDITVQNNTLIASNFTGDSGISWGYTDQIFSNTRIFNNIFYELYSEAVNGGTRPITGLSFEHNIYYEFSVFGSLNGSQISFSTWRATYNQDHVTPDGLNQDPVFTGSVYKLDASSPARNLGIDILNLAGGGVDGSVDAGAYITGSETIGIETGGTPAVPNLTGVTIQGGSVR